MNFLSTKIPWRWARTYSMTVAILIFTFLVSCQKENNPKNAQFRLGNFLVTKASISLHIYDGDQEAATFSPSYGQLTDYQELPPRIYRVLVKSSDRLLLDKKIGLGRDGVYTFVLAGIPEENSRVNEQSTSASLQRIVGGAAVETANAFLPQMLVLNDYFSSGDDRAQVRCINLAPGTQALGATCSTLNQDTTDFVALPYPKLSTTEPINPGKGILGITLSGAPQELYKTDFDFKNKHVYTLFIFPDPKRYLTQLKVVVGSSPSP